MIDYIFAQSDDKLLNFSDTHKEVGCGCLMVQYGIDHFPNKFVFVGDQFWVNRDERAEGITAELAVSFSFFTPIRTGLTNYGVLKRYLIDQGFTPTC